jgi:hypothetical protein
MTEQELSDKCAKWVENFRFYRDPPTKIKLKNWLAYFEQAHFLVAAKVLDNVMIIGEPQIQQGYRDLLKNLVGWDPNPIKRTGRWYFVGFGKPGESGPAMLRLFRQANDLAYSRFDDLFHSLRDLPSLKLTANDHIVFVDDFSGTGRQVTKMWPRVAEMVASEATCYLILTAVTIIAEEIISKNTDLRVFASERLGPERALFHKDNTAFSDEEREIVEKYCRIADSVNPKGYGNLGILFVLAHSTPNNSLPILHVDRPEWKGLFPRYLRTEAGYGTI